MITEDAALWLYGSTARGDSRSDSDVDLLYISNGRETITESYLSGYAKVPVVSRYSWTEIEEMASYGSLFLVHLSLEARPVAEGRAARGKLSRILSSLSDYQRFERDVRSFCESLRDIKYSLSHGGSIPFELANLGTLIRHMSILSCYCQAAPEFGRIAPVTRTIERCGFLPQCKEGFSDLYAFRLSSDGRVKMPSLPCQETIDEWLRIATRLISTLKETRHGASETMH